MPYLIETLGMKLPPTLDRRRKLSDGDRREIIRLYHEEGWAVRKIARHFADKCSRRLIQFVIDPERLKTANAHFKLRRVDGRYYDGEKHTAAMRSTRKHRKENKDKLL